MMKYILMIIFIILYSGCTSQIMSSYIGKDVREVVLEYGNPVNAIDMGNGQRAFQWTKQNGYTTPIYGTTSGSVSTYGSTSWANSNVMITGGDNINWECVYTLFCHWDQANNRWLVIGFKRPNIMCE